jgi:RNA polymerase sigma-70 factor, ECF subfamily
VNRERKPARSMVRGEEVLEERHAPGQTMQDWQSLYQEYVEPIYRYIYSKVGNREEAEDLTEQTFIKAVRGIDYTRSPQSIQKWLFQVARTTIADYWRAYYRLSIESLEELLNRGWEGPVADEATGSVGENPTTYVQALLALLPEHYREVLNCRFLYSLSIRETAVLLELTEANVKVLQFRALKYAATLEKRVVRNSEQERGE